MLDQAGTVIGGSQLRRTPQAPRCISDSIAGSSPRQRSNTSCGAAQSRPRTRSREATPGDTTRTLSPGPLRWLHRLVGRFLGPTFLGHYVRPLRFRGRKLAYDAKSFWGSRYSVALSEGAFVDASTVKVGWSGLRARYAYNAIENAILEHFLSESLPAGPAVLDVGCGVGHWIDFYREVLGAREVIGIELSEPAAGELRRKYADTPEVTIVEADVASPDFELGRTFDVVNAVDVLFHIVSDDDWDRALDNLARHLAPDGVLVVAEHVGRVTHDVGFHRTDEFASREEARRAQADVMLVGKRVRSARRWKTRAEEVGLVLRGDSRLRTSRAVATPANRLMVFTPSGRS